MIQSYANDEVELGSWLICTLFSFGFEVCAFSYLLAKLRSLNRRFGSVA